MELQHSNFTGQTKSGQARKQQWVKPYHLPKMTVNEPEGDMRSERVPERVCLHGSMARVSGRSSCRGMQAENDQWMAAQGHRTSDGASRCGRRIFRSMPSWSRPFTLCDAYHCSGTNGPHETPTVHVSCWTGTCKSGLPTVFSVQRTTMFLTMIRPGPDWKPYPCSNLQDLAASTGNVAR